MAARYDLSPIVQKALREKNLTADEVIRNALHIKPDGFDAGEGVVLPEGTGFMAWYKGRPYWGEVKEGMMALDPACGGGTYASLSAAAAKVTGRATTNGWDFWNIKLLHKNDFVTVKSLRDKAK